MSATKVLTKEATNGVAFDQNGYAFRVAQLFVKQTDPTLRLTHATLGLTSQCGEIASAVKAHWIYGRALDHHNMIEEAGNTLFYLVALLNELELNISDVADANLRKLAKRYPSGYNEASANARADKATEPTQ